MRRKSILVAIVTCNLLATGIAVRYLSNASHDSAPYRHTVQTQVTLRTLSSALAAFNLEYGSLPQGDNVAILRQLTGDNPNKKMFLATPKHYSASSWPPALTVDSQMHIVDGWGSPVRFRFGKSICVESAGEDGRFDTSDDLVEPHSEAGPGGAPHSTARGFL